MALDASLILGGKAPQFDDPLTVQAKQATLADLMGRQQRQQFEMEGLQQERQAAQTLANLWRDSGGDPAKVQSLMAERGMGARIPAFQQQQAATGKAMAEADAVKLGNAKKRLEATGAALSSLLANPNVTPDDVIGQIQRLVQTGAMDQDEGARLARSLPPDPGRLRSVLLQSGLEVMDASKRVDLLLPKTDIQDLGGARQQFSTNQLTGEITPGQSFAKTATPGEVMSSADRAAALAQAAREGAANRGVQMRGQNMTDARARELAKDARDARVAAVSKPLPSSALKMQQESLDAIGISSSVNADLASVEKQITDGKLKFGPVSNLVNTGRNMAGMSSEESRNFSSFKSTLERLRNESLRLNTGVQTDGDAQRAWNELFQNVNDTELVKQRLTEIQGINRRGAQLHRLRVDSVRGNYGAEPLDASAYADQPAAVGARPEARGGAKGGATVELPDGRVMTFPSASAAAAFKKEAGL